MLSVVKKIEDAKKMVGLSVYDGYEEIRFDLMKVVYHWALGMVSAVLVIR